MTKEGYDNMMKWLARVPIWDEKDRQEKRKIYEQLLAAKPKDTETDNKP